MLLQRFIRKHIPGLRILPVSTEHYIPGVILDTSSKRLLGHCRDVLANEPESAWAFTLSEASMVYGTVEMDRKLGVRGRILGVIAVGGNLARDLRVHLDIEEVTGASLDMPQLILQPKLNELRRSDRRGGWRMVNNRFVVTETFYAGKFKANFFRHKELLTRAELGDIARIDIDGEVSYHWETEEALVISKNSKVPFGVRGFVV